MIRRIAGVVLFQAGWIAAVGGAAADLAAAGAAAALAATIGIALAGDEPRGALRLAAIAAIAGPPLDALQVAGGFLAPRGGMLLGVWPPFWLWVLWPLFAATLPLGFRWLYGRYALAAVLGAVAGPASYWAGARLGAAALHPDLWPSLASIGVEWGVAMPALTWLAARVAVRGEESG